MAAKTRKPLRCTRVLAAMLILTLLPACSSTSKRTQLEQVAKDWSMTIRASQVIPVYPLTEDLQPGDIFLVQLPIDRQQELYEQQGFLPLDNHIYRVHPDAYQTFYGHSFLVKPPSSELPHEWWQARADEPSWSRAPNASFPTYSFSVQRGGGFNLAVPLQGVPVGLGLMGGEADEGSVVIADAKTYGLDTVSLASVVEDWARRNRDFLASFAPHGKQQNYLRVVSRVYLTGRVNISLSSSRSASAGLSAGASKPVDVVVPGRDPEVQKRAFEAYQSSLKSLNQGIEESLKKATVDGAEKLLPGGSIRVVAASANSVSLAETFPRPLVVGYLGFDMAIGPDGFLGPPIPTHALLSRQADFPALASVPSAGLARIFNTLRRADDPKAKNLAADLEATATRILPDTYRCDVYQAAQAEGAAPTRTRTAGAPIPTAQRHRFAVLTTYRDELKASIAALRGATAAADAFAAARSCNEATLSEINQALGARAGLLGQARVYAQKIEFGE